MTALDNGEAVAIAIRPTLDRFVSSAEPFCRKAAEDIYEQLLNCTQDYLRDNAEWNIGVEIDRCRKIEHDNTQLRIRNQEVERALAGLTDIMARAESNASGTPDWDVVSTRVNYARHVLAKVGAA